jgi:RimJ/RimL family protein N-acetyltransferase
MFARTPRLLLRPGWAEDAPALAQAIGEEAIVRNLARAPWPYSIDDAREFLALDGDGALPRLLMFARTQGAPRLVGGCGLQRCDDGTIELGYWVARAHWGLGYATEAGQALLGMARTLGHRVVTAKHFVDNPASGHVLQKLGFRPTGRITPGSGRGRGAVHYVLDADEPAADLRMAA